MFRDVKKSVIKLMFCATLILVRPGHGTVEKNRIQMSLLDSHTICVVVQPEHDRLS